MLDQLSGCFVSLDELKFLQLLEPSKRVQMNYEFPIKALESLNKYNRFIDTECLKNELIVFYADKNLQVGHGDICSLLKYFMQNNWTKPCASFTV
ncbi:UNVERIFIED_CONTAM: hypothetical protein FKN15_028114 [Acipenser sinensis]